MNESKFALGKILMTKGVFSMALDDHDFENFVQQSIDRFRHCDWGNISIIDAEANNEAIKEGDQIFASYTQTKTNIKIWIITEWDRNHTTILFPDEY